jgi:hypothetical protein
VSAFSTVAAEVAHRLEQTAAAGSLAEADKLCAQLGSMINELGPILASLSIEELQKRLPAATIGPIPDALSKS